MVLLMYDVDDDHGSGVLRSYCVLSKVSTVDTPWDGLDMGKPAFVIKSQLPLVWCSFLRYDYHLLFTASYGTYVYTIRCPRK
jgi:hypothetical protein